ACCGFTCLFFFFQAEDGIRDRTVTGVQTCALPILGRAVGGGGAVAIRCSVAGWVTVRRASPIAVRRGAVATAVAVRVGAAVTVRSEERRVGKEGRSRGWAYE